MLNEEPNGDALQQNDTISATTAAASSSPPLNQQRPNSGIGALPIDMKKSPNKKKKKVKFINDSDSSSNSESSDADAYDLNKITSFDEKKLRRPLINKKKKKNAQKNDGQVKSIFSIE
jgi:hypothetical protein